MSDTSKREELIRAVQAVTWNASNYPEKAQPHILGQNVVPLTMKIVDAVEAVFEKAHGEPTDLDSCCDVRGGPERCGDCPKDRAQSQGEPSDAQVRMAWRAFDECEHEGSHAAMRAALRAAGEVRGEGR